jgi:hypothetical protein
MREFLILGGAAAALGYLVYWFFTRKPGEGAVRMEDDDTDD